MRLKYWITGLITVFVIIGASLYYLVDFEKPNLKTSQKYELTAYLFLPKSDILYDLTLVIYATIDKNGNCYLVKGYNDNFIYRKFTIPDTILSKLDIFFYKIPSKLDLIHNEQNNDHPPATYHGPYIRLNSRDGKGVKTIEYRVDNNEVYNRFYTHIYSMTREKEYKTFTDTLQIKEMRLEMLMTLKNDYLALHQNKVDITIN